MGDGYPANIGHEKPITNFGGDSASTIGDATLVDRGRTTQEYRGTFHAVGGSNPDSGFGPFDQFSGTVDNARFYGSSQSQDIFGSNPQGK